MPNNPSMQRLMTDILSQIADYILEKLNVFRHCQQEVNAGQKARFPRTADTPAMAFGEAKNNRATAFKPWPGGGGEGEARDGQSICGSQPRRTWPPRITKN